MVSSGISSQNELQSERMRTVRLMKSFDEKRYVLARLHRPGREEIAIGNEPMFFRHSLDLLARDRDEPFFRRRVLYYDDAVPGDAISGNHLLLRELGRNQDAVGSPQGPRDEEREEKSILPADPLRMNAERDVMDMGHHFHGPRKPEWENVLGVKNVDRRSQETPGKRDAVPPEAILGRKRNDFDIGTPEGFEPEPERREPIIG